MSRYSVHPMEKKFIKDTTGVDLDAPPPDLVKKFNTQESDEIESLRKEVEYYRKAQQDFYTPNAALKAQGAASKSYTTEEINEVLKEEIERLRGNYKELLMAVARKFPNETRHQTALRYIHAAEVAELDTPKELK